MQLCKYLFAFSINAFSLKSHLKFMALKHAITNTGILAMTNQEDYVKSILLYIWLLLIQINLHTMWYKMNSEHRSCLFTIEQVHIMMLIIDTSWANTFTYYNLVLLVNALKCSKALWWRIPTSTLKPNNFHKNKGQLNNWCKQHWASCIQKCLNQG